MPAVRPFRRLLVGWDTSRNAAVALRAAAAIAGDEQGHVVALGRVADAAARTGAVPVLLMSAP
jgi:nucleotide-binding universal stress UspA family protein